MFCFRTTHQMVLNESWIVYWLLIDFYMFWLFDIKGFLKNHFWTSPVSNELKGTSIPPKMRKNLTLQTSYHHSVEMKKKVSQKINKINKNEKLSQITFRFSSRRLVGMQRMKIIDKLITLIWQVYLSFAFSIQIIYTKVSSVTNRFIISFVVWHCVTSTCLIVHR